MKFKRLIQSELYSGTKRNEEYFKKYEIKKSNISGNGIFVKNDIKLNENIGLGFEKIYNTNNPDRDYIRTELGKFINHSNKPNTKLNRVKNKYFIITIRDIRKGEELTLDYNKFDWEGNRDFIE